MAGNYLVQASAYADFAQIEHQWETEQKSLKLGDESQGTSLVNGLYFFRVKPIFLGIISGSWSTPVSIVYKGSGQSDVELKVSAETFTYEEDLSIEVEWTQQRKIRGTGFVQVSTDKDFSNIISEINLGKGQSGYLIGLLPGAYHVRALFTYESSQEQIISDTKPLSVVYPFLWWKDRHSYIERGLEVIDTVSRQTLFSLDGDKGCFFTDGENLPSGDIAILGKNIGSQRAESRWVISIYNRQGNILKQINIPEADEWGRLGLALVGSNLYLIGGTDEAYADAKDIFPLILPINIEDGVSSEIIDIGKYGKEKLLAPPSKVIPEESEFPFSREWVRDIIKSGDKYYIFSEGNLSKDKNDYSQAIFLTVCDGNFNILEKETYNPKDNYTYYSALKIWDVSDDKVICYNTQEPSPVESVPYIMTFDLQKETVTNTPLLDVGITLNFQTYRSCIYNDGTILLGYRDGLYFFEYDEYRSSSKPVSTFFVQAPSISTYNEWGLNPVSFKINDVQAISNTIYMVSGIFYSDEKKPLVNTIFIVNRDGDILWQNQELYKNGQDVLPFSLESGDRLLDALEVILSDVPNLYTLVNTIY
ncbi:hypothetical protein [Spirochaeta cellobiosiphila]|uniref:hypothetical protein n=1 Tax=Spirochaeta cellobiosiphila TaxID=504483 RepID=UPI0012EC277A|nr:hypothetical protein [Spirochaeta cellobiosiphila]